MSNYIRSESSKDYISLNESNQFSLKGEEEVYESSQILDSYKLYIEQNKKNSIRPNSNCQIQINNLTNFSFSKINPDTKEKNIYFNDKTENNKMSKVPIEKRHKSIVKVTFFKNIKKIAKKRNEKISKSLPNITRENVIQFNNENEQNEGNNLSIKNGPSPIKETQNHVLREESNSKINDKEFENKIEYNSNSSEELNSEDIQKVLEMNFDSDSKENERRILSCEDKDNYIIIPPGQEISKDELNIYNNSNDKNEEKKEKNYKDIEKENIFNEKNKQKEYNNILSELNNENKNDKQNNDISKENIEYESGNSNENEKVNITYVDIDSGIESIQKVYNENKVDKEKNSLNNCLIINTDNNSNVNRNNYSNNINENNDKNASNNDTLYIQCKNILTQINNYKNKEKGKIALSNSQVDKKNEKNNRKEKEKDLIQNYEKEILIKNEKKKCLEEKDKKFETNEIIDETYIFCRKEKEKKRQKELSLLNKEEQKKQILNIERQSKYNSVPIYIDENKNDNLDNSIFEEVIEIKDSTKKVEKYNYKIKNDKEIKKEEGKNKDMALNIKEEDFGKCKIKDEKRNVNINKDFFEKIKLQIKEEIYSDLINTNSLTPKSKQNITKLKRETIVLKDSDSIDNQNSDEDNEYKNKKFLARKRERPPFFNNHHSIKFDYINEISKKPDFYLSKENHNNFYKTEFIDENNFCDNDDLERTIIKSIENCALNCIYEKIITKSFSSGIKLDRKIMEIIKTRGYSNVKSSLINFRRSQILSRGEEEKDNYFEIGNEKRIQKEFHYNVINDFYYRYKCINIRQNIQKYVCCGKDCNGFAELNLSEKKFVIIQKHSIPTKFHTKFNDDKPIKLMKKRKLEEIHIKINDHNDNFHMEWFK